MQPHRCLRLKLNTLMHGFKEGVIARYMLVDDIRELWNREGLGAFFDLIFGEAKDCKLIASRRAGGHGTAWKTAKY
ncbi:hypothetical protein [Pantoea agglomerans]|uniref:hypothetical protein n=1 Tax=Enterobacter agglomerans TaxID=549 RepID=UPI0013D2037F|nr:hypothetical protein [Pantoea agglomerans]